MKKNHTNLEFESDRLTIFSLDEAAVQLYLQPDNAFEKANGFALTPRHVSPDLLDMLEQFTLPKLALHPEQAIFLLPWIGVDRALNTIVVEAGFKGGPNASGEIEIGYGTMPLHQFKSYASEMVSGMVNWAKKQPNIRAITADTDAANIASQMVLKKNGFIYTHKVEDILWWRLQFKNY